MAGIIGFVGSGLAIWAYVPQIGHLLRQHCSAGISRRAYAIWLIAALLLAAHAMMIRDAVFISLQIANSFLALLILVLAWKYRGGVCPTHASGKNPF